ncbi:hypothetical protein NOMA109596_18015 [Nocardioides marinus]|uniref:FHA domain-containing protein n=1 Tax=Nocardioides marinus TaxID=374514 RepID=A0A7Z0C3Z8_9ACTN|nr:hypothetical protein [Nocardioides marinus]NYI09566.1 hypothetical protein [Nocardioides marinus]
MSTTTGVDAPTRLVLDIDLEITTERADGTTAVVRVHGRGREVVVDLAPDGAAAPPRAGVGVDWAGVRALADLLAARGLALHVERHGRRLLTLGGSDRGGSRRLRGLPPLRVGSPRDLALASIETAGARLLRGVRGARGERSLPAAVRDPLPSTLVIGSHPACDVVLPGLRPRHAVLGRDLEGRSVLKALAGGCTVDGSPVVSQVVDADSDIRVGGHRVSLGELRPQAWCT